MCERCVNVWRVGVGTCARMRLSSCGTSFLPSSQEQTKLDDFELTRTFNCGIGMILVVGPDKLPEVMAALAAVNEPVMELGLISARKSPGDNQVNTHAHTHTRKYNTAHRTHHTDTLMNLTGMTIPPGGSYRRNPGVAGNVLIETRGVCHSSQADPKISTCVW